jgi:transposase
MNDEQINAAIADACGWSKINVEHRSGISPTNGLMMGAEFLPKYCTDLNAMHEAEKVMTYIQLCNYIALLIEFFPEAALATARQRAEAFLRTLGKWEEAK